MAHQIHHIPWHILTTHFKAKSETCGRCKRCGNSDPDHVCPQVVLISRDKPDLDGQLAHFIRRFVGNIREFADTERAKYPAKIPIPRRGPLNPGFSARYLARFEHPIPLWPSIFVYRSLEDARTALDQAVEEWPEGKGEMHRELITPMIKVLLDGEELGPLLALAQHPKGREAFKNAHWGQTHRQGWLTVPESAMAAYVLLNIMTVFPEMQEMAGHFPAITKFRGIYMVAGDYNSQLVTHAHFWSLLTPNQHAHCGPYSQSIFAPHNDAMRQAYIKKCFRLMYYSEMIAHEAGGRIEWEKLLTEMLSIYLGYDKVQTDYAFYRSYTDNYLASTDDNRLPWHKKRIDAKGESQGKRGGS